MEYKKKDDDYARPSTTRGGRGGDRGRGERGRGAPRGGYENREEGARGRGAPRGGYENRDEATRGAPRGGYENRGARGRGGQDNRPERGTRPPLDENTW